MNIGKQIAGQAKPLNICQEWHSKLLTTKGKEELIGMYLKGIDFCIKNDFPTLEYIKANFNGIMQDYGIFADESFVRKQPRKIVALGESTGSVTVGSFGTCEVYVRHKSKVTVNVTGDAFCMVNIYDWGEVEVIASDRAKVCIHNYNATVNYQTSGEARVKLVNKTL